MEQFKGVIKYLIGLIQATGAVLYMGLLTTGGSREHVHLLGGFLVVITLFGLAVFGWPGRREL
ncbi:MAG TPA: hypothetical protein VMM56_11905 [Planctomycetaceae bacterium]|nr:hypothetical protein [Planctomycetaceae bacterium]